MNKQSKFPIFKYNKHLIALLKHNIKFKLFKFAFKKNT